MITLCRFFTFILLLSYSSVFTASFVYHVRLVMQGKGWTFDLDLFTQCLIWAAAGVVALTLLIAPLIGSPFIRLFFPVRRLSLREEVRVMPSLQSVTNLYKEKYGREIKVKLMAMDIPGIEGMAAGNNTIALSTGLLKVGSDEEIAAGIAHEIGHLHYKDSFFNVLMMTAHLPTSVLLFPFAVFSGDKKEGDQKKSSEAKDDDVFGFIIMIVMGLMVYYFPLFLVAVFSGGLFFPVLGVCIKLTDWPIEYRADRFAMNLGLGPSLTSLLENFEDEDIRSKYGFLENYAYTHPPIALRIDKLERALLDDAAVIQPSAIN